MTDNLPTKAIGVLDLFSTSRAGIDQFSDQVIASVNDGEVNALQVKVWTKSMELIIERVNNETKEQQLKEAGKYAEDKFEFAGAMVEKAELGTKYDYSVCGDTEWEQFKQQEEQAANRRKEREALLKAMVKPQNVVTEDGEVVTIKPPLKKSTSGLKITVR